MILVFAFASTVSFSQNQTKKWYFGNTAGLDFVGGPTPLTLGVMNPWEGCASIADGAGNLLFYTDGIKVWNKNHIQMTNGFGLMGNGSTTQSGVIVQKPGSPNIYYIFTEDAQAAVNGLRYSTVDMTLSAGLGDVIAGTKNTPLFTPSDEKITAVRHCNGVDVWVITHDWLSNNFRTFLVTAAGVGAPVITPLGTIHNGSNANTIGQMKASPNGKKLALAIHDAPFNSFELFDFNNSTGVVSNPITLGTVYNWAYGVEFSPDGTKLYGGKYGGGSNSITQWDICAGSTAAILASKVTIGVPAVQMFAFQLATDGKIYVARIGSNMMGVIPNPNIAGVGCGYIDLGQTIAPKTNNLGLPNFVTSYLKVPPPPFTYTVNSSVSCLTASFTPPSVVTTTSSCAAAGTTVTGMTWTFGDPPSGPLNTSTLTSPSHTYPGPGTYTAVLIINYNCTNDTIKVPVTLISPTIAITTTSATCSSLGSATVTAGGGVGPYSYTWSPTAQTTSVAVGLSSGIYSVTVKDNGGGCVVTGTTNLGSVNLMSGTVTTTSVLCNGASTATASLSITGGSGSYSYTWTPTAQTTSVATGLAAGIYTVTSNDLSNSCTVTRTLQIIQPPALTLTAAASTPSACIGNSITLTANINGGSGAGYNYTWTAGPNLNTYVVSQTGGTYVYTVSASDGNNCVKVNSVSVNFINNPNLTVTNSTICIGQVASLTANGATSYVWNPGAFIGSTYTASPANTTTMTVTGANGACTATMNAVVYVNPLPVINMASTNVVCNGQLNGTSTANVVGGNGPFNFVWSTFPVQNTSTALGLGAGNYNVVVTDNNGCVSTGTSAITQPAALTLVINSNTTSVCAGSPINLNAIAAGGTGAINYVWAAGPNTAAYSVTQNIPGNYMYSVTATDANACVIGQNINLTYNPQPTVTATSATVCAGNVAILSASGANTYLWLPSGATGSTFTTTATNSGNITVIGSAIGCTGQAITNIVVNPLPNISASSSALSGCIPLCVDLKSSTSSNIVTYNWTINNAGISGNNMTNHCFQTSGNYSVGLSVTDVNGCMNSSNPINIIIDAHPVADFNYDPIKPLASADLVSFTDASYAANIVSWNWYFMNNAQYTSTLQNPTFTYADAGEYVIALVVKSDKGCSDTILKSILVGEDFGIYMPNSFTPNGDGLNDIFYGKGFGIKKFEMQIFDRWGEKVFTSTDLNEAWDGTFAAKGGTKQIQEGVYTWRIKLTNVFGKSKELTGHVTLIK